MIINIIFFIIYYYDYILYVIHENVVVLLPSKFNIWVIEVIEVCKLYHLKCILVTDQIIWETFVHVKHDIFVQKSIKFHHKMNEMNDYHYEIMLIININHAIYLICII